MQCLTSQTIPLCWWDQNILRKERFEEQKILSQSVFRHSKFMLERDLERDWTTLRSGPAINLQKMPILAKKNNLFRWSSFWSWRVFKQAKLSHLRHWKPARIHWKADAPKTSHCLLGILVQRHNWAIFLRKWARRGRYSQWRSLSGHIERMFVHTNWREGYWQHLVSTGRRYVLTAEATLDILRPVFEDRIISHRADDVWPPRSCDLTPLDYYLWGAVKDKCYADKPEIIDALKDNICIQLHTIDKVLKNWTDRVGYCMASQGNHLNEIIFHY